MQLRKCIQSLMKEKKKPNTQMIDTIQINLDYIIKDKNKLII